MITKKQLKQLGFNVRQKSYGFSPFDFGNGINRREAILSVNSERHIYIKGKKLFFVEGLISEHTAESLWRCRHIDVSHLSFTELVKIVNDTKNGLWVL